MQAVRYHEAGEPDVLRVDEVEKPEPARDELVVEIRAASVNPVDVKFMAGGVPTTPKTTGSDLAGVVAAVGDGVQAYERGDRVFATGLHRPELSSGYIAEFAAVPTEFVASLPEDVTFEEGAAVALVGVTAWRAFVDHAGLEPGATAFVHGGNGGVGHVAVGLADALGVTPVATARPKHHDAVRELGAETVLDYTREDLSEAAREATGGADAILDHMLGEYFETDVDIAAFEGDVVVIAGGDATIPDVTAARSKELDLHLMSMTNLATQPNMPDIGPILTRLGRLLADDRLDVRIDRTYSLDEAAGAHRAVLNESFVGKLVVVP